LIQFINSVLILYCWIAAAILILFLFLIGRFYEIKIGQKSFYQLFMLPLISFLVAALWYAFFAHNSTDASLHDFVGEFGPDLLFLLGGLLLIVLCHSLHRIMLGGKG
jgi:hypothetical protein